MSPFNLKDKLNQAVATNSANRAKWAAQDAAAEAVAAQAPATPQVQVKRYKGERAFRHDAEQMYAAGWTIVGQSSRKQMYSLMTGVFTRKQISTVTWTRGPAPATEAVVPQAGSTADELRKLADLRDAGILTDDEFSAQKAQILGT